MRADKPRAKSGERYSGNSGGIPGKGQPAQTEFCRFTNDRLHMNDGVDATILDLRGLKCPLPALRTRKALSRMPPGAALVVECTDPLAVIDIPNLVRETADILEEHTHRHGVLIFRIRKRDS